LTGRPLSFYSFYFILIIRLNCLAYFGIWLIGECKRHFVVPQRVGNGRHSGRSAKHTKELHQDWRRINGHCLYCYGYGEWRGAGGGETDGLEETTEEGIAFQ